MVMDDYDELYKICKNTPKNISIRGFVYHL